MVYRYDSDEDPYVQYRPGEPDGQTPTTGPPPPAGPSPSRFPTPSLPRPNQIVVPSATPAAAPPPAPPQEPVPRYEPTPPYEPAPPYEPVGAGPAAPRGPVPRYEPAPPYEPAPHEPPPPYELVSAAPHEPTTVAPPPRRGGGRAWQVLIGAAAVLVLLAMGGLAAAALFDGRQLTGQQAAPSVAPETTRSITPADASVLDSRDTDQAPLTAREVFPGDRLAVGDGRSGYEVLRSQSSASCAVAATDEIGDLLVRLGCNQAVRATLRAPDGEHLVTAGLFNLADRSSAERARDRIRQLLDERQGRFRGMAAGDGTEVIATAPARVGWQVRGHYLAYAVVARADGATIRSGDTTVREILFDMLELHLNQGVLERRADGGTASQPTVGPSDRTGSQGESTRD
ncbi:hypothetical protein C1I95_23295 [Micromonospora craterilacus]|uniref:Uncharacterized protein n=1 Tax=Micromonospora craterilacus TaxID=1655439 RepID=A0A2W2EW60_9ACTN|nr:hypothetical protein [Micromonospora craterilacus]PZG13627.1 hypothetical protein C1I95_23295 [Micromonospora craterilacus]